MEVIARPVMPIVRRSTEAHSGSSRPLRMTHALVGASLAAAGDADRRAACHDRAGHARQQLVVAGGIFVFEQRRGTETVEPFGLCGE